MKLFSRKAIAAVVTTVALTSAGLSAPAFASETASETSPAPTSTSSVVETTAPSSAPEGSADFLGSSGGAEGEDSLSSNPKEIREWIAVFTTIIGALSTAFVFFDRLGR